MLKMAVPLMGTLHQKWHKKMGKMMVHLWIEGYFLPQISFWMIGIIGDACRMAVLFVAPDLLIFHPDSTDMADFLSQTQPRIARIFFDPD